MKKLLLFALLQLSIVNCQLSICYAQFKTDRLVMIGRSALYFEDYVLSIQYFNQAISAKPYLYEPWFYRGVAKYYLDDFAGAEADCSEAIKRNPYVVMMYELRGLCRIRQKNYADAIKDFNQALRYDPENQGLWHNRALCHINEKEYDIALLQLDTILTRWSKHAPAYAMKADVYMLQKDTAQAITALEKSLEIDPYDGSLWSQRAIISLSRQEWKESEEYLSKAIHLQPKDASNYINRAVARFNQNNLRGTMADYDMALDLDPNNFLGHYNRGLLRAQVGDDNRAITDFDFVLNLEPDNLMALFNRALLLENTGNLRGAIRDYSKVIEEFPNFWFGLQHRASCYRRLGMTKQAELDEFRILKAQMDKRFSGKQPRLSQKQMRKRSDLDIEKYNQLAVADEQEIEHEYQSEYRGKVQNRKVAIDYLPMYALSYENELNQVKQYVAFDKQVDAYNAKQGRPNPLHIISSNPAMGENDTKRYFALIDSLSGQIDRIRDARRSASLLLKRSFAYSVIQNFDAAIEDASTYLQIDSTSALAYWQRAVCQSKLNDFNASQGTDIRMKTANVLSDLTEAIRYDESAYLYYNRGNVYVQRHDYAHAIEDYTHAIALDSHLAEAYYNRGLARIANKQQEAGISDLSKAGELGLYTAYSIIKKYRK